MDAAQKDKYVKLGLNIAYYRRLRKYTQLELCERLDIDRSYISKIELGNAGRLAGCAFPSLRRAGGPHL